MEQFLSTQDEVVSLVWELIGVSTRGIPGQKSSEVTSLEHMHNDQVLAATLLKPVPVHLLAYLTVFLFLFNWFTKLFIVYPVSKLCFRAITSNDISEQKLSKFGQAVMEFIFHTIFGVVGLMILLNLVWAPLAIKNGIYIWTHQPANDITILPPAMELFYLAYCARFLQALASVFMEKRRKDFWEMVIHHLVSSLLVFFSYQYGQVKVGLLIMVLMDISDPILQLAKVVVYLREEAENSRVRSMLNTVADMLFAAFASSFAITRVVIYPYIVYTAFYDLTTLINPDSATLVERIKAHPYPGMFSLLLILAILQLFWFCLLVKVVVHKILTGEDVDDSRSEADSDEDKKAK